MAISTGINVFLIYLWSAEINNSAELPLKYNWRISILVRNEKYLLESDRIAQNAYVNNKKLEWDYNFKNMLSRGNCESEATC